MTTSEQDATDAGHERGRRPPERHETRAERADRNFSELAQELRVAQTGVQILFAFLLSLPFLPEFPHEPPYEGVLASALLTAAGSTVCFIAPVAFHRALFRQGMKEEIVTLAHRLAVAGLALLVIAMSLATWLVLATLWADGVATVVVAALVVVVAMLWLLPPRLLGRDRH